MFRRILRTVVVVIASCAAPGPTSAQTGPASGAGQAGGTPREVRGQLGASINNLGLQTTLEVSWKRPLTTSTNPLLADAHLSAGVVTVMTPALGRLGGWVEFAPLSVLTIRAGTEPGAYFGTFNALKSFDAYTEPFDDEAKDAKDRRTGTGMRSFLTPSVQFRAGPVVALVSGEFEHWRSSADGPLFYEPTRDTLLKSGGDWLLNSTSVAMLQHDYSQGGFISAGLIHNLTRVFDAPGNQVQRLGVLAIREFGTPRLRLPRLRLTATVWR
ncbi:MAG: hypothetical protein Q7V01_00380 [Vicinamibacterales bacterium]|nr:hypothetical protein [Vicinamibacterales bacterium]